MQWIVPTTTHDDATVCEHKREPGSFFGLQFATAPIDVRYGRGNRSFEQLTVGCVELDAIPDKTGQHPKKELFAICFAQPKTLQVSRFLNQLWLELIKTTQRSIVRKGPAPVSKRVRIQRTDISDGREPDVGHNRLSVHGFGLMAELPILESRRFMTH
jgi:hypothetical protein